MRSILAMLTANFMSSLLLFSFLIIGYVYLYLRRNRDYYEKINKFNSLPTIPLLGNMLPVLLSRKSRFDIILDTVSRYEEWKPFVFWLSYVPIVFVTKYEDIQIVSNRSLWRNGLGKFHKIIGDGIPISHPDKWRNIRRAVNPAFGPTMLQQYLIAFNKHTKNMVCKLNDICDTGKMIDIFHFMEDNNLKIVTENMAGVDLDEVQVEYSNKFSYSLSTALKLEMSRFFEPWKFPDLIYYLYLLFSGQKDLYKNLHEMPNKVIQTKFKEYRLQKEKLPISNSNPNTDRLVKTYIDILIRLHDTNPAFTKQQIHDEVISMIAAGSESTALVSSFILLMLAIHQEAQERVYQEIVEVFGNDSSKIEVRMEDLVGRKFEYLDKCMKETLRKYTLAPIMSRETTEEVTLTDGNVIPTGTFILMVHRALHHDSKIFPDPEKWDPEHFAEESVKPFFLPFGTGPKSCIGSKYAMLSLKTQIIHILHRYQLSTNIGPNDTELEYDLTIRRKGGFPVTITLRKNNNK